MNIRLPKTVKELYTLVDECARVQVGRKLSSEEDGIDIDSEADDEATSQKKKNKKHNKRRKDKALLFERAASSSATCLPCASPRPCWCRPPPRAPRSPFALAPVGSGLPPAPAPRPRAALGLYRRPPPGASVLGLARPPRTPAAHPGPPRLGRPQLRPRRLPLASAWPERLRQLHLQPPARPRHELSLPSQAPLGLPPSAQPGPAGSVPPGFGSPRADSLPCPPAGSRGPASPCLGRLAPLVGVRLVAPPC
nr:formin-like protein 5 [Aegilops tauschii subsp. strangulata]